jgi:hypothetical protein
MSETNKAARTRCVVETTRRVLVELADGVSEERFIELLNKRHVQLKGEHELLNGYTGEVLGRRIMAANTSDYKLLAKPRQSPLPELEFKLPDIHDFDYNQI